MRHHRANTHPRPTDSPSVPDVRLEAGVDALEFCRRWVTSPSLIDLVTAFGGEPSWFALRTPEMLATLDGFSKAWDFRQQKERNESETTSFDAAIEGLVESTAATLGLLDTLPPARAHYDHVLILGGLSRGCIARPLHAASLLGAAVISADLVTALSAFRPLNATERTILDVVEAPADLESEFDVMDLGVRRAFALNGSADESREDGADATATWRVRRYEVPNGPPVQVVAAPAPRRGTRANTGDTYRWLAREWGAFFEGQSVLIVTTYHYRLYQLADAIRELGIPFLLEVDAVGLRPGDVDVRLAWEPTAAGLLQELRSAIRALRALDREARARHS